MSLKEEIQEEAQTDPPQSTASTAEDFTFKKRMSRPVNFPSSNSRRPQYEVTRKADGIAYLGLPIDQDSEDQSPTLETPVNPEEFIRRLQGLRGGAPLRDRKPDGIVPLRVKMLLWFKDNLFSLLGGATVGAMIYFFYRYLSSVNVKKIEESVKEGLLTDDQ